MNYSKFISEELGKKDIDLNIDDIPLTVFLKSGDVLNLCFIERETIDTLIIYETTTQLIDGEIILRDELRILPKDNVEYIGIVYDFELLDVDINVKDKMFL